MTCIYVLYSSLLHKIYIGSSRNDEGKNRLKSHDAGKTRSTKAGRPWVIIKEEVFKTFTEARKRENFLKTGAGRGEIKKAEPGTLEGWQSG